MDATLDSPKHDPELSSAARAAVAQRPPPGGAAAPFAPQLLAAASAVITGEAEDEDIGETIAAQVAQALQATDVRLALFDTNRQWLEVRAAIGPSTRLLGEQLPLGDGVMRELLEVGEPLLMNEVGKRRLTTQDDEPRATSRAAALVRLKEMVLGYLLVGRVRVLPAYTADDLLLLQVLADLAGLRLGYSQLAIRPRQREQELAQLAAVWRPAPDLAGDFVIVTDLQGRVLDADGGACRLLGYTHEEMLHLGIPDISPVPPGADERAALQERMERARDGREIAYESSVRRRDDTLFPVRVQLEILELRDRTVVRGIGWDLSERKEAQARLLQTERLRVLGQMASGVAHDLNNTLAHVLGNLQLLLVQVQDPEQRALLERMQQAAWHGAETVKRLHSFARSREAQAEAVDLSAIVREVAALTRPSWNTLTQEKGVAVDLQVDVAPVPPVMGNAAELSEVLVNLVHNALDALPQGGTVRLHTEATEREVILTVSDTGMGMPPRVRSRIFDPFFTTKGPKGSGLGLSIAYTIVARHRGQITVESEPGQGTTFTIQLPADAAAAEVERAPVPPALALQPRAGRILAVDDERELATMLERMLERDGHQVQVCTSGAEALELLAREPFDLLLTDVSMPNMDGWEVARQAKRLHPGLPVGLVTGWGAQYDGIDLAARGVDFMVSKPFAIAAVRGAVMRALARAADSESAGV